MPCGKRPFVKKWKKTKDLRVITSSRYEKNEASVKEHWMGVVRALELSYKDEAFWETQADIVRGLVGPILFRRIAKIFDLQAEATKYMPKPEPSSSILPSEEFYTHVISKTDLPTQYSRTVGSSSEEEEEDEEEEDEDRSAVWTTSSMITVAPSLDEKFKMKSASSKGLVLTKTLSKLLSRSFSRCIAKTLSKEQATKSKTMKSDHGVYSPDSSAGTSDELIVHPSQTEGLYRLYKVKSNPHFDMLYTNESETDMIKWDSHYKTKTFEVSASDEFSKKAEILTKQIAKDFFDWWVDLGNLEFKSEIKRPEDLETLFQIWFDEHASRGLMLNPKIIPCVLPSIANYTRNKRAACPNALKRQIEYDIMAETDPAHVKAFGGSLPHKMKHIPPKNNTQKMWHGAIIPEDLRTMSCVWSEIQHLTSTKAFQTWLVKHPNLPMPPCLAQLHATVEKAQKFQVPSDYFMKSGSTDSAQDLALPVSQLSVELKQVLSRLMNE